VEAILRRAAFNSRRAEVEGEGEGGICIVRSVFYGDQPFTEGTPLGDAVLKVLKRLSPLFKILNKKLHGSQGEEIDLYDVLKHSIGNYGISDFNAILNLK
jgi:hypothetical protein